MLKTWTYSVCSNPPFVHSMSNNHSNTNFPWELSLFSTWDPSNLCPLAHLTLTTAFWEDDMSIPILLGGWENRCKDIKWPTRDLKSAGGGGQVWWQNPPSLPVHGVAFPRSSEARAPPLDTQDVVQLKPDLSLPLRLIVMGLVAYPMNKMQVFDLDKHFGREVHRDFKLLNPGPGIYCGLNTSRSEPGNTRKGWKD